MNCAIGVDIGSTCAKVVVLNEKQEICFRLVQPTGWSSVDTAGTIRETLQEAGFDPDQLPVVATGYGRIAVPYAKKTLTEITCHAQGACRLFDREDLTVIDIGGQDTKIISVRDGAVQDFLMNDKCSAGTGRFLEVMANTLALRPDELCDLARQGGGTAISSMCTVFAESEVISLIGRGEKRENIACAVVDSVVQKVAAQAGKLTGTVGTICLTGGLCQCDFIREALSRALGNPVITCDDGRFAGAVGAALRALKL
ncbi:MAG: CoA activase [Clostridia bacterium]|nr:CoA activase [Clostridia bacterium]